VSLTSELKNPKSPLSAFMAAEFPGTRSLSAAFREARPADADALTPSVPEGTRVMWGTLNAAFDHRLRYAFTDSDDLPQGMSITLAGVGQLADPSSAAPIRQAGMDQWSMLVELVREDRPGNRDHPLLLPCAAAETRLARLCYAMAWYEEVYRTGRLWPRTPLGDAGPAFTVTDLLNAVPEYAVADLLGQVRLASDALDSLRAKHASSDVWDGPTFAGSADVGGADADLIAGDLLIDVKGTVTPSRLGKKKFYQLLGYALLDYDDEYGIRQLGFYLSRFGRLVTWPVEEYLALLGCTRPLGDLRRAFTDALAGA
jgi:hypothetical protein